MAGLDPGPVESALVLWDGEQIVDAYQQPNEYIMPQVLDLTARHSLLVIEQIASYGMAVGETTFETVFWSGRFAQAHLSQGGQWSRIKRLEVKLHLCHDSRAKDANIRQAILDRFGGRDKALGKKKAPGPLYGISGDLWSALAVALTYHDNNAGAK